MTLQEFNENTTEKCDRCSIYWSAVGLPEIAYRGDMYMRRCKECFIDQGSRYERRRLNKEEMMLFSERMSFAEALTKWRDQEMQKIGWKVKDVERLKKNYMDCISALVGLGLIDIAKSRQFIADMRGEIEC